MRKLLLLFAAALIALTSAAQGWPANYGGVMLQGFFWDSYLPMPDGGPNGSYGYYNNRKEVNPNLTWATIYGAGWGEGNDEWAVPITTWAGLINSKQYITPYIDLLWLPQSGASIADALVTFNGGYQERPWYGSSDPTGSSGNNWKYYNGNTIHNPGCNGFVPYYWFNHGRDGLTSFFGTEQELRNLISQYKANGCGAIEDVVINHKGYNSENKWIDETYTDRNGNTRNTNWSVADLVSGKSSGYTENGGIGTGEDDGLTAEQSWAPELAHMSTNVQENTLNYLNFLKNDLGYVGFRFDYAKGLSPKRFAHYNEEIKPTFSVGEFWDGFDAVSGWIKNTNNGEGPMSAAFDFPLHEKMKTAFNDESGHSFRELQKDGLIWQYDKKRYAVTFVENHDTFKWICTDNDAPNFQHRMNHQVMEANAFILAMPGTPCLFYPHFMKDWDKSTGWHADMVKMIHARRAAGITNEAAIWPAEEIGSYGIRWRLTGNNGEIYFALGSEAVAAGVPTGFTAIWTADMAYYAISNDCLARYNAMSAADYVKPDLINGYPVIDKRSGAYSGNNLTVNVKPSSDGCTLVYTTNGTTPTGSSRRITDAQNGEDITFYESGTLKVGVLIDNEMVQGSMVAREYVLGTPSGGNGKFTVYVRGDSAPYLYMWKEDEHRASTGEITAAFPGDKMTDTKTVGGIQWYCKTYDKPSTGTVNLIINWGGNDSKQQTVRGIDNDVFYVLFDKVPTDVTNDYLQALDNPKVTIDMPTGEYSGKLTAKLSATNSDAVVYYTTDGSAPTTSSSHVTHTGTVKFETDGTNMLRAAVYHKGEMINEVVRTYWLKDASEVVSWENKTPETSGVTIYVEASQAPNIYAWKYDGSGDITSAFPGDAMTEIRKVGDKEYYYWHTSQSACKFIINQGDDSHKTADQKAASSGSYFFTYNGTSTLTDVSTTRSLVTVTNNTQYNASGSLYIWCRDINSVNNSPYIYYYNTSENTGGVGPNAMTGSVTVNGKKWWYKKLTWINNGSGFIIFTNNTSWSVQTPNIGKDQTIDYWFEQGNHYWFEFDSSKTNKSSATVNKEVNTDGYLTDLVQAPTRTNRYSSEQKKNVSTATNVVSTQFPSCASPLGDDYYYFYYENSKPYNDPYTWVWNGTKVYSGSCWPGEALVEVVGTSSDGNLIYRWAYKKTSSSEVAPTNCIFNNYGDNTSQTSDLVFHNGGYYRGDTYLGTVTGGTSYTLAGLIGSNETYVSDGTDVTKKYVIENDLYVGYVDYSNNCLFVRDVDGDALNYSAPIPGQRLYEDPSNFDQANWMEIEFTDGTLPTGLSGKIIKGQTLYGWLIDKTNPKLQTDYDPLQLNVVTPARHLFNSYYIVNFLHDRGEYFWVDPKPQEYVEIRNVMYDPATTSFYVHDRHNAGIGADATERIQISAGDYWNGTDSWDDVLTTMNSSQLYGLERVYAIVKVSQSGGNNAPAVGGRTTKDVPSGTTYSLSLVSADPSVVTAIDDIKGEVVAKTVKAVKYYNLMGVESDYPFDGVNIIVTTYTDGTQSSSKVIR